MCRLMFCDLREASPGKGRQTGVSESLSVELCQSAFIERILEVLQGKRKVEDCGV